MEKSDTVKIIHDHNNKVLYTSRSPIPYCKEKIFKKIVCKKNIWDLRIQKNI